MNYQLLFNIVGLSLNIIGAIFIWKYGLPANINRDGHINLILEGEDETEKNLAKKYDFISRIGMSLLILGFFFQLIALFIIK